MVFILLTIDEPEQKEDKGTDNKNGDGGARQTTLKPPTPKTYVSFFYI